ncbi:MetQ/NlpA family ABC transporter substrate-binding protein [Enterococcus sp. C53]|uniref:MetQ/NlpA family ABC transporter substrate-binding protein n=2 Tax=unclassified Enterococcus TaxID=2608891 RepID=UPI0034A0746B
MEAIKEICDEVAVIDSGKVIEQATTKKMFLSPQSNLVREFLADMIYPKYPKKESISFNYVLYFLMNATNYARFQESKMEGTVYDIKTIHISGERFFAMYFLTNKIPDNEFIDQLISYEKVTVLESERYTIKRIEFSQFIQSNTALGEGKIDVNVAQHSAYMNVFNKENGTDLVPLVATPSVPCNLYSSKYTSKEEVKKGMMIGIPQDPSNAARAYAVLAKAGFIQVDKQVKSTDLTAKAITNNPYQLNIKEMDTNTLPHVLDDLDFEVIPGSTVEDAGIRQQLHLIELEKMVPELQIVAAVTKENEKTDWAKAIKKAYRSEKFRTYINSHNKDNYWIIPDISETENSSQ